MEKLRSDRVIRQIIPPLTMWALKRLLESKGGRRTLHKVDARAYAAQRNASKAIGRRMQNARENRVWLAAGAVALLVGVGLMLRAMRSE